jgi:KUP system potassium uptake protein
MDVDALIATAFASSEGEGGPFSLFTGLYGDRDDDEDDLASPPGLAVFRVRTGESEKPTPRALKPSILERPAIKWLLLILALLGTSLTLADGLLTPAVSSARTR